MLFLGELTGLTTSYEPSDIESENRSGELLKASDIEEREDVREDVVLFGQIFSSSCSEQAVRRLFLLLTTVYRIDRRPVRSHSLKLGTKLPCQRETKRRSILRDRGVSRGAYQCRIGFSVFLLLWGVNLVRIRAAGPFESSAS